MWTDAGHKSDSKLALVLTSRGDCGLKFKRWMAQRHAAQVVVMIRSVVSQAMTLLGWQGGIAYAGPGYDVCIGIENRADLDDNDECSTHYPQNTCR